MVSGMGTFPGTPTGYPPGATDSLTMAVAAAKQAEQVNQQQQQQQQQKTDGTATAGQPQQQQPPSSAAQMYMQQKKVSCTTLVFGFLPILYDHFHLIFNQIISKNCCFPFFSGGFLCGSVHFGVGSSGSYILFLLFVNIHKASQLILNSYTHPVLESVYMVLEILVESM